MKTKPVCPICGTDDVICDANAVWSVVLQQWEVKDIFDDGYCCECNEDIDLTWEDVEE